MMIISTRVSQRWFKLNRKKSAAKIAQINRLTTSSKCLLPSHSRSRMKSRLLWQSARRKSLKFKLHRQLWCRWNKSETSNWSLVGHLKCVQFYNWFRHHCTKPYTNCRPPREEPHRGGEWSSENEKSRQILPKSRNLAQATHGSRSLRFCVCRSHICFSIKLLHFFDSGSDFKMPV